MRPLSRKHDKGVTTPNVKNRTVRPVAQTCRHWKGNRNRLLQPRNDGSRLGNAALHKRSFVQAEERLSVAAAPELPILRLSRTKISLRRLALDVYSGYALTEVG